MEQPSLTPLDHQPTTPLLQSGVAPPERYGSLPLDNQQMDVSRMSMRDFLGISHEDLARGNQLDLGIDIEFHQPEVIPTESIRFELEAIDAVEPANIPEDITQDRVESFLTDQLQAMQKFLNGKQPGLGDRFVESYRQEAARKGRFSVNTEGAKPVIDQFRLPMTSKAAPESSVFSRSRVPDQGETKSIVDSARKAMATVAKGLLSEAGIRLSEKQFDGEFQMALADHLSTRPEWTQSVRYEVAPGVQNIYEPLGDKTAQHFITDDPINAWRTSIQHDGVTSTTYRHGTFAPIPKKVGMEKDARIGDQTQQEVADRRAEKLARRMIEDKIRATTALGNEVESRFTFNLSNINEMRQLLIEAGISETHDTALKNLAGKSPLTVSVDGKDYTVDLNVRRWHQDIKDGPYLWNSTQAAEGNREAMRSIDQDIRKLEERGIPKAELDKIRSLRNTLKSQLEMQRGGKAFLMLLGGLAKGIVNIPLRAISKALSYLTLSSDRFDFTIGNVFMMDPLEVSGLIVALESKIGQHLPGGLSHGCKSGKDRGSLVDAVGKMTLLMADSGKDGLDLVRKPGWLLFSVKNDQEIAQTMRNLLVSNHHLQRANTGFEGYITRDSATVAGNSGVVRALKALALGFLGWRTTSYADRIGDHTMGHKGAINAGSGMVKD